MWRYREYVGIIQYYIMHVMATCHFAGSVTS